MEGKKTKPGALNDAILPRFGGPFALVGLFTPSPASFSYFASPPPPLYPLTLNKDMPTIPETEEIPRTLKLIRTVREQEDTVTLHEEETSFLIRVTESLSLECHSSTRTPTKSGRSSKNHAVSKRAKDRNSENHPPSACAQDSMSLAKSSPSSFTSACKGDTSKRVGEDNRTNNRFSVVSRPRAVLSSPDNDDLIGNQNQQLEEKNVQPMKQSANQHLQKPSTIHHPQDLRKLPHKHARAESPLRRAKPPSEHRSSSHKKLAPVCTK